MAADISRVKTERRTLKEITFTALSTTGVTVDFDGVDENTVLIFTCSVNDTTVKVMKGNGIEGVADLDLSLTKDKFYVLALPSMEFKSMKGTDKGYLTIKGAATSSVAVAEIAEI